MYFFEKSNQIKIGIAFITIAIAVINYAQSDVKEHVFSIAKIHNAAANTWCINAPGQTCYWVTPDGLTHVTPNAEMGGD